MRDIGDNSTVLGTVKLSNGVSNRFPKEIGLYKINTNMHFYMLDNFKTMQALNFHQTFHNNNIPNSYDSNLLLFNCKSIQYLTLHGRFNGIHVIALF